MWRNEQLDTKGVSNRDMFAQKIRNKIGKYKQDTVGRCLL
jgi:hypothetical protein